MLAAQVLSSGTQDRCFLVLLSSVVLGEIQAASPQAHSSRSDQLYTHQFFLSASLISFLRCFEDVSSTLDCLCQCLAILQ